jgi:hypothetical protein
VDFDVTAAECDLSRRVGTRCTGSEDVLPNAALAPASETVVDRLVRSILSRALFPATSDLLYMHDATQYPSIIMALGTALIGRQMWLYLGPLFIVEPNKSVLIGSVPHRVDQTTESTHG